MALTTINHPRHIDLRLAIGALVALAAFVAIIAFVNTRESGTTTTPVDRGSVGVVSSSGGPNQDLAPLWGTGSSSAAETGMSTAVLGPNQDLAPLWGIERSPADGAREVVVRGPNQDLAPGWGG